MMLTDDVKEELKGEFAKLGGPVRLAVFSQALADPESEQVRRLVEEVGALDERISVDSYNFVLDKDKAEALGIARIPAVAVLGPERDPGIHFYGSLAYYEFGMLIQALIDVSSGETGLSEEARQKLAGLKNKVHVQVFSTPT